MDIKRKTIEENNGERKDVVNGNEHKNQKKAQKVTLQRKGER